MKEAALIQFAAICDFNDSLPPDEAEVAWRILASSLVDAAARSKDMWAVMRRAEKVTTK